LAQQLDASFERRRDLRLKLAILVAEFFADLCARLRAELTHSRAPRE
jgi:hypothetical protein